MTDGNHSMNEVPALLEERRRYEAWIAALDARRDSTPAHVFERVQSDYRNRLQQVAARLATFRQAMEGERASVQSRLSLLEAEEQMRRDERAELDLRAHVGELAGDEATSAFSTVDDAITHLAGEKGGLQRRVAELDSLLAEPAVELPAPPVADEIEKEAPPLEELTPEPAAPPSPERPSTPGGSFDEMAFLDAVVGKDGKGTPDMTSSEPPREPAPAPTYERIIQRDEPDSDSLLAGLGRTRVGGEDQPLAANVPANTPIVLRPSGSIEQSKTLKCNECGAMNYPTEWYCERCGAELAAL
jgi:hypothetical protein